MTEKPEVSVPTARRAAQHFRLSSADDAYEHLYSPRAPERFVASPLCLVGYVRWDARSDRVPPPRQSFSAALQVALRMADHPDRKSTSLNSSHANISYA